MALPRQLALMRLRTPCLLRPVLPSIARGYATETLTIPNPLSSAPTIDTTPASGARSPNASSAPLEREQRYSVTRTGFRNLPVYLETSGGGTHISTIIRRIEGDSQALRDDIIADKTLLATLAVDPSNIKVNPVTRHVIVKGSHVKKLQLWLQIKGF